MNPTLANQRNRVRLLVWSTLIACWMLGQVNALPDSLRSYSRVVYMRPEFDTAQLFTVEEFSDTRNGNIMLKVRDDRSSSPKFKNYYRIFGGSSKTERSHPNAIMEYDAEENNCNFLYLDRWPLQGVTNIIETIVTNTTSSSSTKMGFGTKLQLNNNTVSGPTTLLRLILSNAEEFKMDSHNLRDESYFRSKYALSGGKIMAVIVTLPTGLYAKQGKDTVSSLADFDPDELYTLSVSFVIIDEHDDLNYSEYLLTGYVLSDKESLHISFMAIQERSMSKHQGLGAFDADEENPFTLPEAAGCGAGSKLFYLNAKQFSGLFTASNSVQQFIAFDGGSSHLRIDRLGQSKMIYNFGRNKRLIYVADRQSGGGGAGRNGSSSNQCASALLPDQKTDELGLAEIRTMADIIGFDSGVGLNYLGSRTLEDGAHCLVFERELSSPDKIPLIARLNHRFSPQPNDRLYLTLYFVDEFVESKRNAENRAGATDDKRSAERGSSLLDSIWLKRIELRTKKSISRYSVMISRLTFSQSAWSLEVWAEYENDRKSRDLHPVRTFDTIECESPVAEVDSAFKLELILEQTSPITNDSTPAIRPNSGQHEIFDQSEILEEALMMFLTKTTRIPRSHINQLELLLPEHRVIASSAATIENYTILVEAKIVNPIEFQFQRNLLGWVKAFREIEIALKDDVVLLLADESSNNRHECMMNVATSIQTEHTKSKLMLFCPHVGCGYIKDIGSFKYIEAPPVGNRSTSSAATDIPTVNNFYDLCEIHSLKRLTFPVDSTNKFHPEDIKHQLKNAEFSMKAARADIGSIDDDDDFTGKVVKVSVVKGGHHPSHALGQFLRSGLCFTEKMLLTPPKSDVGNSTQLKSVQITLDAHRSSAIYCQKACLLFPYCRTYSYSKTGRVCTLTDLPRSDVLSFALRHPEMMTTEDPGCQLYAVNPMRLYTSLQMSLVTSLAGLDLAHQHYFQPGDRETCANLCHDHELLLSSTREEGEEEEEEEEKFSCSGFKYFSLSSICAIEDKKSYLYRKFQKPTRGRGKFYEEMSNHFRSLLSNPSDWKEANQCQFYERDYSQYYDVKANTKFNMPPIKQDDQKPAKATTADNEWGKATKLIELKTLYDIDLRDCLRECTIVERNCLMVDHCFHPIFSTPTKYCTMYQLDDSEQPNQADKHLGSTEGILSELLQAAERNGPADSQQAPFFTINPSCSNYRLTADYLMLKTRVFQVPVSSSNLDGRLLDGISKQDERRSDTFLEGIPKGALSGAVAGGQSHELSDARSADQGSTKFSFWSATLMLLVGSVSGLLAASFLVEHPRVRSTIETVRNDNESGNDHFGGLLTTQAALGEIHPPRAQPSHEFNELLELYEN